MGDELEITKNDRDGMQVTWKHILFTLRPNQYHGFHGSLAVKEDEGDGLKLLEFHGRHPEAPLPFEFHETTMNGDGADDDADAEVGVGDRAYSDKLDPHQQVSMEERLAAYVFDNCEADEETAAEAGRKILKMVLAEFRPDLFRSS